MDRSTLVRNVGLAVATLVLAYAAFASALAGVVKISHPSVALNFDANQPTALAVLADEALLQTDDRTAPDRAAEQARAALRSLALSPAALRILGLTNGERAGAGQTLALMDLSTRVSRHDFGAQLWWIEHQVGQGNAARALEHYDIAMRINQSARTLLIPVLFAALDDAQIQRDIVPYVRAGSPWVQELIVHATAPGRDPSSLVEPLLRAGAYVKSTEFGRLARQTMEGLLAAGKVDAVQRLYGVLPGSDPSLLERADFNKASMQEQFIPVAWDLSASSTAGSALEKSGGRYVLRAFVGGGEHGTVARKLMFLKPGSYAFSTRAEIVSTASRQMAVWQIVCMKMAQREVVWKADALPGKATSLAQPLVIQPDCPAQSVELDLQAGEGLAGLELIVRSIEFRKL
jgi:hypothetical protein